MPTVCAAQLTARTFTCRLSLPSGETTRKGEPWAVLEQLSVSEPLAEFAAAGTAHESSVSAASVPSEFNEISRNDGWRPSLAGGSGQQRRELSRDHATRGAAQARTRLLGLAGQGIDVAQQRAEFEMLVEVQREQLGEQRQPLRPGQVRVRAGFHLFGFALQQRTHEFAEHRRAQVGLGFLALVAQRLRVVLRGDRDLTLLERVGRVETDDGGRDRQQRDRERVDDVGRKPGVLAPVAARRRCRIRASRTGAGQPQSTLTVTGSERLRNSCSRGVGARHLAL